MTTATAPQNKVTVHDAGPSSKKIHIEIPAEAVSEKLRGSLDMVAASAALPGFRPGRVPRQLVEKKFGEGIRKEAKDQLIGEAFRKAIDDLKLKLVGEPTATGIEKVEVHDGKPLAFEVEVEVLPEFTLPSLEGIEVKKPMLEVTDAVVADEVKKICINEGQLETRETCEPGDYCTGHAVMKDDKGTEFYNLQGAVVQSPTADKNGKGMILGIIVDDFAKQLGKPKAGDTLTVKANGPEQHEVEGIRGAKLTMTFKIDRIDRIMPASADDIVKAYGLESEEQLKDAIRQRLQMNVQIQQTSAMQNQIAKHLIDKTPMELPKRITATQAARTLERRRLELLYRGVEPGKIEEHMAELRTASGNVAQRDLKLFFVLTQAAEQLNVQVSQNEVNGRIAQMAFQRNVRPEAMVQELRRTNQLMGVIQQIRDHKVFEAIIAKAKVSEVSAEEYNKSVKEN
jgi:trigger factor